MKDSRFIAFYGGPFDGDVMEVETQFGVPPDKLGVVADGDVTDDTDPEDLYWYCRHEFTLPSRLSNRMIFVFSGWSDRRPIYTRRALIRVGLRILRAEKKRRAKCER